MSDKVNLFKKCSVLVGIMIVLAIVAERVMSAAEERPPEKKAASPAAGAVSESKGTKTESGEGTEKEEKLSLWKIIRLGGPLMYVLFALSVALVAMITYFFLAFSPGNVMPPAFLRRVQQMLREKKTDEARMYCAQNRNAVSHIIRSGLEAAHKGPQGVLEAMNSEGSRRASSLWQKISFLSDIAVIAPMVGLLGTVIGMFQAFMGITRPGGTTVGMVRPAALASGVAQAVITTIAGLIIGILATMAYAYFRGVVQKIVINLEAVCSRYSDSISETSQ